LGDGAKGWNLPDLKGKFNKSILKDLGKDIKVNFGRTEESYYGRSGVGGAGGQAIVKSEI
jgi:hypothetical protein